MAKSNSVSPAGIVDCACVIHSTGYDWAYVDRLYNMLSRVFPNGIRFHVYTEADRRVPAHMIKHVLKDWPGISGPKKSWWYKMQLFNPEHFAGDLLYLDLDVVVVRELDWVKQLDTSFFWGIRDFRHLQNRAKVTINSSMMWWNVSQFSYVWDKFIADDVATVARRFPGDQDYITHAISQTQRRFFEDKYFESYRWQTLDGGYMFNKRQHVRPGSGVLINGDTALVVFHGSPKPNQVTDPAIVELWR